MINDKCPELLFIHHSSFRIYHCPHSSLRIHHYWLWLIAHRSLLTAATTVPLSPYQVSSVIPLTTPNLLTG